MYLPKDSSSKRIKNMMSHFADQYRKILTNPIINGYACTPEKSDRVYSHYSTENTDVHDKLKLLYDAKTGFICSVLKAYHSHKTIVMVFYESQDHHIYLLRFDRNRLLMPIHFNSDQETKDWHLLKYAEVYLKFNKMKEISK